MKNRKVVYDLLKIIAIFMVLYNHRYTFTCSNTFNKITLGYVITALLSIICKCGPPLFLMVSGALLLKKEEKFSYILKHRVLKIIIIMLICTLLVMLRDENYDFLKIFSSGLNWYLYQYLAYLFMLPFLRKITLYSNEKDMNLFFMLVYIFYSLSGVFSFFKYSFTLFDKLPIYNSNWGSVCWCLIFPISGCFLSEILKDNSKIKKYFVKFRNFSTINLIVALILCSFDIKMNNGKSLEILRQHAIYPISCFIFICIYSIGNGIKNIKLRKVLMVLSNATLGIFIIDTHTEFSHMLCDTLNLYLGSNLHLYFVSIIAIILEFIIYTIVMSILRLIPFVKKVL